MRIYTAGFFTSHGVSSVNATLAKLAGPDWMLESYYYMKEARDTEKMSGYLKEHKASIFLDSGAFTAYTKGADLKLPEYAEYIRTHQDLVHVASSIDVIAKNDAEAKQVAERSYDNYKKLLQLGAKVQPVHHCKDPDHWLQRYLDEGVDYIFLGGMVPETTGYLRDWLDHMWATYLTNKDGTPKVKVHGFGLTTLELMERYPWYSVDSTSWILTSRYGAVYLDFPKRDKIFKIDFSLRSRKRKEDGSWHYLALAPQEQRVIDERLEELEAERTKYPEDEEWAEKNTGIKPGFTPEALGHYYGMRDWANVQFFNRRQAHVPTKFINKQINLGLW